MVRRRRRQCVNASMHARRHIMHGSVLLLHACASHRAAGHARQSVRQQYYSHAEYRRAIGGAWSEFFGIGPKSVVDVGDLKTNTINPLVQQLHHAIQAGNVARMMELLDQGVAVDSMDFSRWTPLMYASARSRSEIVTLLLDRFADFNAADDYDGKWGPFLVASFRRYLDVVRILAARGANIHQRTNGGSRHFWGLSTTAYPSTSAFYLLAWILWKPMSL